MKITYTLSAVLTLLAISAFQVQRSPDAGAAPPDGVHLDALPDGRGRTTRPGHAGAVPDLPCLWPADASELPSSACAEVAPATSAWPGADRPALQDDPKTRQRDRAG